MFILFLVTFLLVVLLGPLLWMGWMLYHATIRVLSDRPDVPEGFIQAIFPQALSPGEDTLIFDLTPMAAKALGCPVLLNGSEGRDRAGMRLVWAGGRAWEIELRSRGVSHMIFMPPSFDTYDEMCHLLEWLEENYSKGGRVVIVSLPHRALRTMLTFLKARRDLGMPHHFAWINVPSAIPWWGKAQGSQGSEQGELYRHIWPELKRILWHRGRTYLPFLPQLFTYWRARERQVRLWKIFDDHIAVQSAPESE